MEVDSSLDGPDAAIGARPIDVELVEIGSAAKPKSGGGDKQEQTEQCEEAAQAAIEGVHRAALYNVALAEGGLQFSRIGVDHDAGSNSLARGAVGGGGVGAAERGRGGGGGGGEGKDLRS